MLSSNRLYFIICVLIVMLMAGHFSWRIHLAEIRLQKQTDEHVAKISDRLIQHLKPLIVNVYEKSPELNINDETTSAILDTEMKPDLIRGIKVFGNFGHVLVSKFKSANDKLNSLSDNFTINAFEVNIARHPVSKNNMTLGNIEVYYTYNFVRKRLHKIIIQELMHTALLTLLLLSASYLLRKLFTKKA